MKHAVFVAGSERPNPRNAAAFNLLGFQQPSTIARFDAKGLVVRKRRQHIDRVTAVTQAEGKLVHELAAWIDVGWIMVDYDEDAQRAFSHSSA
jgi:hypothetical protein